MKALGFPEVFGVYSNSYFLKPSPTTRGHAQDLQRSSGASQVGGVELRRELADFFFSANFFQFFPVWMT
jgi:hypothetical protein